MVSNTGVADVYWAHYGPHRFTVQRHRGLSGVSSCYAYGHRVGETSVEHFSRYFAELRLSWLFLLKILHLLNNFCASASLQSCCIYGAVSPSVDSPTNLLSVQSGCSTENHLHLLLCTVDGEPVLHIVIMLPTEPTGPFTFLFFTLSISVSGWLMFTCGGGCSDVYVAAHCRVFRSTSQQHHWTGKPV